MLIQTTGLEEYAPGGKARVKVLTIGGPGAGKTRWASYFPKPIYADCERGLASVADRNVPYVDIKTSQDMLDLLAYLKQECAQPDDQRKYQTVVIDTLDAYQRKIKNEWMEKEKKQTFTGWEAWGYLNARMQALMTRLLNLDLNIVVAVHFKDKTTKDDVSGRETHELMLQLQGETADTAFNDFDMVGWLGTYWESVDGERVQKRGLTFRPTPDKPFLKDRLYVTPQWLPVNFEPSDYTSLFERVQAKLESIPESEVIGEVPTETEANPSPYVIAPGQIGSGALPAQAAKPLPYLQMDKPTLQKLARDRGVTATAQGEAIRHNTLKAELIAALEAHDHAPTPAAAAAAPSPAQPAEPARAAEDPQPSPPKPLREPAAQPTEPDVPRPAAKARSVKATEAGPVDTSTGEILDEHEKAIAAVETGLGASVLADAVTPPKSAPAPPAPAPAPVLVCEECQKPLADEEDPDLVKLSWIKYRKRLCGVHFAERKNANH